MISIWDILSEILTDYGLQETKQLSLSQPGQFRIGSASNKKYHCFITVWCRNNKSLSIYQSIHHNKHSLISIISGNAEYKEIIDLCDPDCITKINNFLNKVEGFHD